VLGEGNFVLVVAEGTFGGRRTSYYDLYRIQGGKFAEHWDTLESIQPSSEWKNLNGKILSRSHSQPVGWEGKGVRARARATAEGGKDGRIGK
jgi:hypothetical protein